MSAAAHDAGVGGDGKRVSHLAGGIRGDAWVWNWLALGRVVGTSHLGDGRRQRRAHMMLLGLLLLLLLERIERTHAGERHRAVAAGGTGAIGLVDLLIVGRRIVILSALQRGRRVGGWTWVADGLTRLAPGLLRGRHGRGVRGRTVLQVIEMWTVSIVVVLLRHILPRCKRGEGGFLRPLSHFLSRAFGLAHWQRLSSLTASPRTGRTVAISPSEHARSLAASGSRESLSRSSHPGEKAGAGGVDDSTWASLQRVSGWA